MTEAQQQFDAHLGPACPSELGAPKLHVVLADVTRYLSVLLLARIAAELGVELIMEELGIPMQVDCSAETGHVSQQVVGRTLFENLRARLVALCLVDADGNRLFGDDEIDQLGEEPSSVLGQLFMVAQKLNGLAAAAVVQAEKN